MALLGLRNVSWGVGGAPVLENITLSIEKGERVGLLGRNGVGKSTLLKLLCGAVAPDQGEVWHQQGVIVAALAQEVPRQIDGTVFDVVAEGLSHTGLALPKIQNLYPAPGDPNHLQPASLRGDAGHLPKKEPAASAARQIDEVLSRTGLDPEQKFADLSAGMKRRVLFARALARQPDVLLLDEPTNHLDIDAIMWMEGHVLRNVKTLLFVTHDRVFLQKIATRILIIDRGALISYACDYRTYLTRRQADAESEVKQDARFDKKLSQEEDWIRQGIKARRTRDEGRVRALEKMRAAHRARRQKIGQVRLKVQDAEKTGKLVIEAQGVSLAYAGTPIISDFSTVILRGDKVGLIGPNGCGKTTLLKVLLKQIDPQAGSVRHGTHLKVAYFDQLRTQLDEQRSIVQNIGEGNDFVIVNGQKRHVIGYLQDFLFTPERSRTPVSILSGGEKNRLMLAKLFARPANVLVLDEPTNDLDTETLELLEELLLDYAGTLLLVSHDRAFLNHVVTSTLVFEGQGRVGEYVGGYDDWLAQRPKPQAAPRTEAKIGKAIRPLSAAPKKRKLGFREKQELSDLPQKIEALEASRQSLFATLSDPLLYKKEKGEVAALKARLAQVEDEIDSAFRRWEALEDIAQSSI